MLTCLLFAGGCAGSEGGEGGGGNTPEASSSLPRDKTLGSLTAGELETLCAEQAEYLSDAGFKEESCRISAIFGAAVTVGLSENPTNAMVQAECASRYAQCLERPFVAPSCRSEDMPPSASCTATIAEVTACVSETRAALHMLAADAPDCDALTIEAAPASGMAGSGSSAGSGSGEPLASCMVVQTKCPSISDESRAFADQYCAHIAPCCEGAGGGTECTVRVYEAAEAGSYDASEGAACLAALAARESSDTYCDQLRPESYEQWPSVIPECDGVFPELASRSSFDGPMPPTTDQAGVACVGTFVESAGPSSPAFASFLDPGAPPSQGTLCAQQAGLFCDRTSRVCTAGGALGATCENNEECDGRTGYCESTTSTCVARIEAGASCAGTSFGSCEQGAYCLLSTMLCVRAGNLGEACSPYSDAALPECASGNCRDGVCASALEPVCGT